LYDQSTVTLSAGEIGGVYPMFSNASIDLTNVTVGDIETLHSNVNILAGNVSGIEIDSSQAVLCVQTADILRIMSSSEALVRVHTADLLIVSGDSKATLQGGSFGQLSVSDNSQLIADGVNANEIYHESHDNHSHMTFSQGHIGTIFRGRDFSETEISDSTTNSIESHEYSLVNLLDSYISGSVTAYEDSEITVDDCYIAGNVTASGNACVELLGGYFNGDVTAGSGEATIILHGLDFAIDGLAVDLGRYYASDFAAGRITGQMLNGDLLDCNFSISGNSSILLVPEPASLLLLAAGALSAFRRRRLA